MKAILKLFLSISLLTALPFVISSAEADDAIIFASCKKDLQLSESACQCVLSEVHDNLKPNQLEMFMAMIQGDGAAIAQAQSSGKMSGNDMMLLTNFMATTPTKCQNK